MQFHAQCHFKYPIRNFHQISANFPIPISTAFGCTRGCRYILYAVPATLSSFDLLVIGQRKVMIFNVITWLVARKSIIGTLMKPQLAPVFACFHSLVFSFSLEFLAKCCKIVQIFAALDKNLASLLTKGVTKMQERFLSRISRVFSL